jgi:hypothetical protein
MATGGWTTREDEDGNVQSGRWIENEDGTRSWQAGQAPVYRDWTAADGNAPGRGQGGFMGGRSMRASDSVDSDGQESTRWEYRADFDPYAYRTDKNKPPELSDFFNAWNQKHVEQTGAGYNRPWNKHGETGLRDGIVKQYTDAVAEYNRLHGTNIQPDQQAIQKISAAPSDFAQADTTQSDGGFFASGVGQMVMIGAAMMGAPYLSAFIGGGLAGSVGAGAIIGGGSAALTGGNVLQGAALGGLGGGVGYGFSGGAGASGLEGSPAGAESWSDWGTSGAGWTGGGDLPVGSYTGGIPSAGEGAAAADVGAGVDWVGGSSPTSPDWVSGGDLPGGDYTGGGEWTSGGDLSTGDYTSSGIPQTAAATTGGAGMPGPAAGGPAAGPAAGGLTGNATVDTVLKGLSAAGVPQALMGTIVSNLVANGLFDADDAREAAKRYTDAATGALNNNQSITQEQYNRWKTQYAPLEDELISQARRGMGNEEVDSIMGRINADATQQFGKARENLSEELRRRGIAPGSGAEILGLSELGATEAASKNGAQTTAKEGVRQFDRQFGMQVAGMGRGIPSQTITNLSNQTTQNAGLADRSNQLGMQQQYAAGQATAPFVRAANQWFDTNLFKSNAGIPGTGGSAATERFGGFNNLEFGSGGYA